MALSNDFDLNLPVDVYLITEGWRDDIPEVTAQQQGVKAALLFNPDPLIYLDATTTPLDRNKKYKFTSSQGDFVSKDISPFIIDGKIEGYEINCEK